MCVLSRYAGPIGPSAEPPLRCRGARCARLRLENGNARLERVRPRGHAWGTRRGVGSRELCVGRSQICYSLTCSARSLSVRSMSGTVLRCSAGLFFEVERARCNGWKAGIWGISCDHIMTLEQRAPPCQESTPPCPYISVSCSRPRTPCARERAAARLSLLFSRGSVRLLLASSCSAALVPPAGRTAAACSRATLVRKRGRAGEHEPPLERSHWAT